MKQLFFVSSPFQLVMLVAALDAGLIGDAEERVVIIADNRIAYEVGDAFYTSVLSQQLLQSFDRSELLNDALQPYSNFQWSPRESDLLIFERAFRSLWDLDDSELELYVESIQTPPATTFARIFRTADVHVYADGLMSYGPTRNRIPATIRQRLVRLLYLDLIPGLRPTLLEETSTSQVPIDAQRFAATIRSLAPDAIPAKTGNAEGRMITAEAGERTALIIGQYLSDIGLITVEEESDLYFRMVELAHRRGFERVLFKRHPAASYAAETAVETRSREAGIDFAIVDTPELVEITVLSVDPGLVIGCFSTALITLRTAFGYPVASLGTPEMLEAVAPYENNNRVPLVLTHRLLDEQARDNVPDPAELRGLLDAVSYCMQPLLRADLRERAIEFLTPLPLEEIRIYFKRRRLTKLDLPGRLPPVEPVRGGVKARAHTWARRVRKRAGRIRRRVMGR